MENDPRDSDSRPPHRDEEPPGGRAHRHRRRHRHGERKERVLHTRVSEQLSQDIRQLAEDLRVPASNLVRNVLEEVFTVVENVSDDVGDLFEDLVVEAEGARDRLRASGRTGRRRSARRRSRRSSDGDVERELARDERSEWGGGFRGTEDERASDAARSGEPAAHEPAAADARQEGADCAAEASEPTRTPPFENPFPEVLGWQPLVLNHDVACGQCGVQLVRGRRAFVGLTAQGLSGVTLCRACVGS
jgi:hypothetical protein